MRLLALALAVGGYAAAVAFEVPSLLLVSAVGWTLLGSRLSWVTVLLLAALLAAGVLLYAALTSGEEAAGAVLVALSVTLFLLAGRLVRALLRRGASPARPPSVRR